jgi:membrane-associated phospholipid phosphatase
MLNDPLVIWLYPTIAAGWLCVHLAINVHVARHGMATSTLTRFDAAIPFVPGAVGLYLSGFMLANVGYFLRYAPGDARWSAAGYALQYLISLVLYLVLPTRAPRLALEARTGMSARALRLYQRISKPFNAFPSMHVSLCVYSACWVWLVVSGTPLAIVTAVWCVAVTGSTLLTRQHTIVDVAGGFTLGVSAFVVVNMANRW